MQANEFRVVDENNHTLQVFTAEPVNGVNCGFAIYGNTLAAHKGACTFLEERKSQGEHVSLQARVRTEWKPVFLSEGDE